MNRRTIAAVLLVPFLLFIVSPRHASGQFLASGPDLRLNGFVFAVESDASGNAYLGGSFNEFNGDESGGLGLLRLTPAGTKHALWDIGYIDGVSDLLVSGNYLYVAGSFLNVRTLSSGTINRPYLLRIHLTGPNEGKVDTTWVPVANASVENLETDGTNLYISGSFTTVNGSSRSRLAKILIANADPDLLDSSWAPSTNGAVNDIEYVGGFLYVSGGFSSAGGFANNYLVRLSTSTGSADSSWKPIINRPVGELESTASHLYFGGDFTLVEGANHRGIGRYSTAAGAAAIDGGWKPDPDGEVVAIAISGTNVFVSGVFTTVGGTARGFMAKLSTTSSSLDASFLPQPNGAVNDMKVISGGLLAGGRFNTTNGAASAGYALMNTTSGAALGSFAGTISTEGQIYAMEPVSGGMIIGGLFDSVGGSPRTSIARILSNGSLDTSFNPVLVGFNRAVTDIKLDGSHVYFCGDFISVGGAPAQHLARVNPSTGAVDSGWHTKPLTPLHCLETDGSYVYIGSAGLRFIETSPGNAVDVNNLARISKGGTATPDPTWKPYIVDDNSNPATAAIYDLQMSGSTLIIGGRFAFIVNPGNISEAHQRICLAGLSTSGWGQPVSGWGTTLLSSSGGLGTVSELLLFNGSLYAAGDFMSIDGNPWYYVAKFNPSNGAWDYAFDVSPVDSTEFPGPNKVRSLAASGSHLYIAGEFDHVYTGSAGDGYDPSPYIARVDAASGLLDPSWYPYPDGPVTRIAFQGSNLWAYGSFSFLGGSVAEGPVIIMPFSSAYNTWLNTYFTPAQRSNPALTAPFLDLDNDGDPNLLEAAFNMNPFSPVKTYHTAGTGTSGLPLIRRENVSGQNYLTMEFTRWKDSVNSGVIFTPEFGDDLVTWPRSGVVISTTSIDTNRERVKVRDSVPNTTRSFGRVRVTNRPQ